MEDPNVMRLKPSILRHVILLLTSAGLVAMGAFLVTRGQPFGWVCIAFFGMGVLVILLTLLPGSSYLELRPGGIELSSLYRKWFVRWSDVQEFFPTRVATKQMVCWNYTPGYAAQARGRRLSMGLAGVEAGLPDTYGLSAQELSALLNEWRAKHTGERPNNSFKPNPLRGSA